MVVLSSDVGSVRSFDVDSAKKMLVLFRTVRSKFHWPAWSKVCRNIIRTFQNGGKYLSVVAMAVATLRLLLCGKVLRSKVLLRKIATREFATAKSLWRASKDCLRLTA